MSIVSTVFSRRRIRLVILLFLLYVFGSPLVIFSSHQHAAEPQLQSFELDDLSEKARQYFGQVEAELGGLGFQLAGSFSMPQSANNVGLALQVFTNEHTRDAAAVISLVAYQNETQAIVNQFCEFTTYYQDGRSFNTNNSAELSAFKSPDDTTTISAPWISDTGRLFEAHSLLLAAETAPTEKVLQLDDEYSGDALEYLLDGMRHELEHAVADGYLKLSSDKKRYVPTLRGAYVMTWSQMWPMKPWVRSTAERNARRKLAVAGFQ